jgi:hypothetical protein
MSKLNGINTLFPSCKSFLKQINRYKSTTYVKFTTPEEPMEAFDMRQSQRR